MKKMKLLLIGLSVAMVALCGCSKSNDEQVNQNDEVEQEPVQEVLTSVENAIYVQYTDNTTTITLVNEESVWYFEGDMETWLDQATVYEIVDLVSNLESQDVVSDAGALADYGLETPAYTVLVKDGEGNETTIYIGNSLEDGTYYATIDEKEKVYIISEQLVGTLEFNTGMLIEVVEEYDDEEIIEEDTTEVIEEEEDTSYIEDEEEIIEEDSSSETEE